MSYNSNTNCYEGYIYIIFNDIDTKKYIGQTTTSITQRWSDHKKALKNTKRYNTPLYIAMRQYGIKHFNYKEIKKLCYPTIEELIKQLNNCEKYYIKYYKTSIDENGYNIENGGRHDAKKVYQYDLNLQLLNIYNDLNDASFKTGIDKSSIRHVCSHDRLTSHNFIFCYENDSPLPPISRQKRGIRYQYEMKDYSGNIIKVFNSIKEIDTYLQLKKCKTGLLAAIREGRRYHNYYWEQIAI